MLNQCCSYQVDAEDKIIYIGGGWNTFAIANGGNSLATSPPLGKSLWSCINGLSTRFIYQSLVNKVRRTKQKISLPLRCDAPDTLRYLELEISPGARDSIWFRTTLKKEIDQNSLSPIAKPDLMEQPTIKMCAWCKLIAFRDSWLTIEDVIWFHGLLDGPEVPPITHGICPDCNQQMETELAEIKTVLQKNPI